MSYRNLEIWKMARDLSVDIHTVTLSLPKFEQFEEAQQYTQQSHFRPGNKVEEPAETYFLSAEDPESRI